MGVAAAVEKHSKHLPHTKPMPIAAAVQTPGWDLDVDLGDCLATINHAFHGPVPNSPQLAAIINLSAVMDYLRLYQQPEVDGSQHMLPSELSVHFDAQSCVCCGTHASLDEVGFCATCTEVSQPD